MKLQLSNFPYVVLIVLTALAIGTLTGCAREVDTNTLYAEYEHHRTERNWSQAVKVLTRIAKREPQDAKAYFLRAKSLSNKKHKPIDSILTDLNKSIELDPLYNRAYLVRFQANFISLRMNAAISDIDTLMRRKGRVPFLVHSRGDCLFVLKDFTASQKMYEERLTLVGTPAELQQAYYYKNTLKIFWRRQIWSGMGLCIS